MPMSGTTLRFPCCEQSVMSISARKREAVPQSFRASHKQPLLAGPATCAPVKALQRVRASSDRSHPLSNKRSTVYVLLGMTEGTHERGWGPRLFSRVQMEHFRRTGGMYVVCKGAETVRMKIHAYLRATGEIGHVRAPLAISPHKKGREAVRQHKQTSTLLPQ